MKKWFPLVLVLCVATAVQAQEEGKKEEAKKKAPANITKAQFVERQKAMAEKKGVEYDPAAVEAKFAKMDKNKDGVLSPDEQNKKKKKKEKKETEPEDSAESDSE